LAAKALTVKANVSVASMILENNEDFILPLLLSRSASGNG
jgi:hypothetical protein